MEENKTVCPECGTPNEKEYVYCKNCGFPLAGEHQKASVQAPPPVYQPPAAPVAPPVEPVTPPPVSSAVYTPYGAFPSGEIGGVPMEDIGFFIGKKSSSILPKFIKMELTRSNTSWCWPAAILGFFFGPIGASLWFFYRKMVKPALLLLAIGAAFAVATMLLSPTTPIDLSAIYQSALNGDTQEAIQAFRNSIATPSTALGALAGILENVVSLATATLAGLFGYAAYKKHCVSKILAFRQSGIDMRYYKMGLAANGGTSGGLLALGIIALIVINEIVDLIPYFL